MERRGENRQSLAQAARGAGRIAPLGAIVLAAAIAWPHPAHSQVAEGNRLYDEGKYAEAVQHYGEALVDNPDSDLARFNLAAAQYKEGKYADAIASLQKIQPGDDKRASATAYNLGNAYFRVGENGAAKDPQAALTSYEQALTAYKRAMGANPANTDAKFNHEFVEAKLEELKKKIEEQKQQQQDQQEQQQDQQQQQQDQQQGQPEQQEQQQGGQEEQQEQQPQEAPQEQQQEEQGQQQEQAENQPSAQEEQQAERNPEESGAAGAAEEAGDEQEKTDRQQAQGIIDTARQEELTPEEMHRSKGVAVVGEPSEDW